ncbi:MAG TPA: hypothetical protein VEF04_00745, partial [Blastocatellia bacterium]|nr:hypothetical protein [Blastocatellia bacterium]
NFRKSLARAIDQSFLKTAEIGTYLKGYAEQFQVLTERLKKRSRDAQPISSDIQEVLNRGAYLDSFMSIYGFDAQAKSDWHSLSGELNQLANFYKIKTYWGVPKGIGAPPRPDLDAMANRLIGTYVLDRSQSEDVRRVVEREVNSLPQSQRRRTLTALLARLQTPEKVAIDRQQDTVTLASTLQTARVYKASGRTVPGNGEPANVSLYGNQFRLYTTNELDSLFSTTYTTFDSGAGLRVIRTALLTQLARPIVVVSYYKKISDVPQLNLGVDEPGSNGTLGQTRTQ